MEEMYKLSNLEEDKYANLYVLGTQIFIITQKVIMPPVAKPYKKMVSLLYQSVCDRLGVTQLKPTNCIIN